MNKDQLKAAFAKGARIQAWHLLPGATNSNQGQWDTLTPAEGAEPEFACEAHLYRVHPEDLTLIAELGQEVGAVVPVSELARLLPGPYYMDPPDGGDVSVLEQLQRMSVDARCWREHISGAAIFDFGPVAWIASDNALQFNEDFIESGLWQPGVRFYTCPQDVGMTPEDDTSPAHTSETRDALAYADPKELSEYLGGTSGPLLRIGPQNAIRCVPFYSGEPE